MAEPIELLAPARTADIGIEAIRHGADAVYIGAPQFGARQAAGNSLEDISRLVAFARPFGAKVYATVNTLLYDDELPAARCLIRQLHAAGVDALIVQDMAVLTLLRQLWPAGDGLQAHASTQMDNRTPAQVRFLSEQGFRQVVLARELSLGDITAIHAQCPDVVLEVFVHGALCVSLSGRCYASEALCGRSANRGACAQICRLPFDLEDASGQKILRQQHLLSLKDLCHLDALEDLLAAGARAFKIEGRLKDMAYVKNVTAAYSLALDRLVALHPDRWRRSSRGNVSLRFTPDVRKSFNRGFTHYFLYGRGPSSSSPQERIFSPHTPKSLGEPVGRVAQVAAGSFIIDGTVALANGDGLCFFDRNQRFHGFRVNRVEGRRIYWRNSEQDEGVRHIRRGTQLFRNYDKTFADTLGKASAERVLPIDFALMQQGTSIELVASDGERSVCISHAVDLEPAHTPQADNIRRQLSRLGDTPFRLSHLHIDCPDNPFIPSSLLAAWRREAVAALLSQPRRQALPAQPIDKGNTADTPTPLNVANQMAHQFYANLGAKCIPPAFELSHDANTPLMTCRHCLAHALGACSEQTGRTPQPLFLRMPDSRRLTLHFDCQACQMLVHPG